ncbi:MAG: sugar phosphate nucleotidyltransferase [Acidimicrobiales bacterium]|nr:sugar phosphate nucleotidyltransferase [Acidimicrobiales bacterium]
MQTVILCGGMGTRAYPHTLEVPKPLLEVGDRPVLAHLMEIYAAQGFTSFVLAAGYKLPLVEAFARELPAAWDVEVVDTGETTNTGGRVRRLADRLAEDFFVTYADGLGNVDLAALRDFHRGHRGVATLTTVPLPSQYGTLDVDESGRVHRFKEKPRLTDHLINAGFFVFDRRAFDLWPDPGEDLERHVLPALGDRDELFAFRHLGFWRSMDTYKDAVELGALCESGPGPWLAPPGDHA